MSSDLPDDEQGLVELAASCSDAAFCELMRRFQRLLAHAVSRSTNDPEDRRDLHSEIIVRLLSQQKKPLRDWRPTAPFGAYLAAIASRHCYNWADRKGLLAHKPPRSLESATSLVEPQALDDLRTQSASFDPPAALDHSERVRLLHRAVGRLPDADRLILKLRFGDDLSGPIIADLLGVSHGAARQRILRALRRLERELAEIEPGYFG